MLRMSRPVLAVFARAASRVGLPSRKPPRRPAVGWLRFPFAAALLLRLSAPLRAAESDPSTPPPPEDLSLRECIRRVVDFNESLQAKGLEWLASQKRMNAARGIFEPEVVGSYEHNENVRQNTVEQQVSLGVPIFTENNNSYSGGLEMLSVSGAKFRVGYSLRELENNLQRIYASTSGLRQEFVSFTGVTLVQPLLKGAWAPATLAGIRLAAAESEVAFQEYRRQSMLVLARAESTYWDLVLSQAQLDIRSNSVGVAETLLEDNRRRLQAGKSSELEVVEAEAGLAAREAKLSDARQRLAEANNRLTSLFSGSSAFRNLQVHAVDRLEIQEVELDYFDGMRTALEANPDYLAQRRQVVQENIRLAYARNQRWPQLDLKASYGLNGLGETVTGSHDAMTSGDYDSWAVGVELRIPVGGNVKGRNELAAAKLRRQQALLTLKQVETDLSNALDIGIRRVRSARDSSGSYRKVHEFNERLLRTELARLEVGKTDSRRVLETEEKLSESLSAELESVVNYQKAVLEWELVRGDFLKRKDLELTREQLEEKTAQVLRGGAWTDRDYAAYRQEAAAEVSRLMQPMTSETEKQLREALERKRRELETEAPSRGAQPTK